MRQAGLNARVQSALNIEQVVEPYIATRRSATSRKARSSFLRGDRQPVLYDRYRSGAAGTEIGAEMVLKATKVDGIYTGRSQTPSGRQALRQAEL